MNTSGEFGSVYKHLKKILLRHAADLECLKEEADNYYLNTSHLMKNKKPLFFGSVNIQKNYVAYHLMPVYVFPQLLENISPELRRRMQGKSCFNFTTVDAELFFELGLLTEAGFERYLCAGYVDSER